MYAFSYLVPVLNWKIEVNKSHINMNKARDF